MCDHTYLLQKSSKFLYEVVGKHLSKDYIKDEGVMKLIQAFLCPKHLIKSPESSTLVDHREKKLDPLYNLFMPHSGKQRSEMKQIC